MSAIIPTLEGRILALMRGGFNGQNAASIYWKLFSTFSHGQAWALDQALERMVIINLIFEGQNNRFYLVEKEPKKQASTGGAKTAGQNAFKSDSPGEGIAKKGWERSGY